MDKTIYTKGHRELVKRLIEARKKAGLRQEDAAKLLRKTQSYISKIEAGQRRIDIIQLKEFAKIYKKDLDFFTKLACRSARIHGLINRGEIRLHDHGAVGSCPAPGSRKVCHRGVESHMSINIKRIENILQIGRTINNQSSELVQYLLE